MPFDGMPVTAPIRKKADKLGPRGCDACPLNKVNGINKIMGTIEGKDILVVAQSPGPEENEAGRELVGRSGQFLWDELKKVGIRRSDCDIQNVVRCFPADLTEGSYNSFLKMRNPSAQEIHCCSIHTETAMATAHPKHILILGQVAQKAFLQTRSVPKQKIFWSDQFKAKIYLADHPAFFIRGYGAGARLEAFQSTLRELAAGWKNAEVTSDNFAYLREQKYYLISTKTKAERVERIIGTYAGKGWRIAVDIEHDDLYPGMVVFAIGFSPKPGLAFTLVFDYPGMPNQTEDDARACWAVAQRILENPEIKKVFHYGCSDVSVLEKAQVKVRGYTWDTNFSEYLWYPDAKAYGLGEVAERRFQQFSGYKSIIVDDLFDAIPAEVKVPSAVLRGSYQSKVDWLVSHDQFHLSRLRPDTLRLYNGADCDLTKRIEIDLKKKVPQALVRLYIDLSFVLKAMEANGPWFDLWQNRQVAKLWPALEAKALQKLRDGIGDPEFNPGSPVQVYKAIYETLGLEYPLRKGKPNTQKKTLMMLSREHPFPGDVVAWRKLSKGLSTYIISPREVAARFHGRAKTTWWATGTGTGRLSSSGGSEGGMNLQNLHNDPRLQNQFVADRRWRKVFNAITVILKRHREGEWEECIEVWVRIEMPDLRTFLVLDYGQIEVRVAAQLSGDEMLIKDCSESDIHTVVGHHMTGWPKDKIKHDKKTRTLTKNVHFGILFGIDRRNLYDFIKAMDPTFNGTEEEVFAAYDRYFERYKGIRAYIDAQREKTERDGYCETLFGLHRVLNITGFRGAFEEDEEYVDESGERQASWRNQCVNTPVQGTAHQLLECGLVNIRRQPKKYEVLGVPSMDVHDALYMMPRVLDLREAYRKARYLLEQESLATVRSDFPAIAWRVPIATEAEAGLRLGGKVELENDKFTVGGFLLRWYELTKKQICELHQELSKEGVLRDAS